MDLREMDYEGMNWIWLAQDMPRGGALWTGSKPLGSTKAGNFLKAEKLSTSNADRVPHI